MRETRPRYNSVCLLVALLLLVPLFSMNGLAAPVPDSPTDVTAWGSNSRITINWTAPVNTGGYPITGYSIYKGTSPTDMRVYVVVASTPFTYQDNVVENGQTYYYYVTAHNVNGEGAPSSTVSDMPLNVPSAPTAPTATSGIGQMIIGWNPPYNEGGSPVTNYRIYRGTSASLLLFLKDSAQTTATDSGLSNGQTYFYQISAVNAVGEGTKCAVFQGTLASAPGPLLDLQAVASDSKVTLTWTAPSDNGGSPVTGYIVYRSVASGEENVLQPVTATTYLDLNLVNGVTYYYQVSAVNAVGEGQPSSEVACTPAAVLGPPTSITAVPSNSVISMSWTAPANTGGSTASSYKIYRGTSATTLLFLASVTLTSYQDTGLTNGQIYFYKISSVNSVGEGAQSSAVGATPFSTPSVPLSLTGTSGNGGVSLDWSPPFSNGGSSVLRYHIYWSDSATGPWTMIDTLSAGTVYAHSGLTNGQTYYYQVAAVNSAGEGPRTATASATPHTVPSAPAIISATGGTGNVTLTWTAPASDGGSALTKYSVYRGTSSGSETFLRDAGQSLTVIDNTVSAGTTYYYRVTVWNSQGESPRSNGASATTFGAPTPPTALTCTAGDSLISLHWDAPGSDGGSSVLAYRVFFGSSPGVYSANQTVSSNSFLHGSLTNGVRYFYAVAAINSVGQGPLSAESSAVPMTNPTAPQSLLATAGVRQIYLSWQPPLVNGGSNVTGYKLYRGPTATSHSLIAVLGPEREFTDTGLLNGTTYHYSVSAINSQGESLRSLESSARTNSVPTVPTGLSVTAGNSQATLSWSAPSDNGGSAIGSYGIYRSTVQGSYVLVANTASLIYTDPGLTNGQRYYYAVSAVNPVGEGPRTVQLSVLPASIPSEPQWLMATPGVKSITLSWTAPTTDGGSPLLGYHILRGNAPGSETQYADVGTTSFADSSLDDGETHYYEVIAYNAIGNGPASDEVYATTLSLPSAPTFLQATVSDRSVSLHWSEPVNGGGTPIAYYSLYQGDSPSSMSLLTSISSRSYDVSGLVNGHLYYFAVSATNAVGEGSLTTPLSAMPSKTPSVPLQFASVAGIRQVALSWSAPTDNGGAAITGYHLYRSLTETGSYDFVVSLGATSYTDTQLNNGAKYYYRLAAVNSAGEGPYAETSATTYSIPEPSVLNATVSGLDVHLTWSASESATSYRIYRGDVSGEETYLRSALTLGYVDGPFASGRTLYYYVTSVNVTGESAHSNEASVTIVTPPSAPTDLTAEIAGTKAVLRWEAPSNHGSSPTLTYQVLRGPTHGSEVPIGTSTTTTYNDTTIVSRERYYYQVKAVNSAGTSAPSNEVTLLYSNTFTAPVLTVSAGIERVLLRWTVPSQTNGYPLTGYQVYRGSTSGSETFLIAVNVTEMTDTSVIAGQTYYYQVRGTTAVETGPASNEGSATPYTYPGVPASFVATPAERSANLNWSVPTSDGFSPILGYHVFRGVTVSNLSQVASVTTLRHLDVGLAAGTTYYYRVAAFNAAGDGNLSSPLAITTPIVIDPPIGLTATGAEGKITLVWNQPAGANVFTYSIFRGNGTGEEVFLINYPATSWVDFNVTAGQNYYYRVSALTMNGESQMSEEAVASPKASHVDPHDGLLDQMWFRVLIIMGILAGGFFSFILFVRKGTLRVRRDR